MTKALSRDKLRFLSKLFRAIFKSTPNEKFDVLRALDMLPDVFEGTTCLIVDDDKLPPNIPARCYPDENGNFTIEIKNSVYLGAYKKEIGAYRGHICHEICHVFLYKIGFTPIFNRQFGNNEIPAFCSVEWQAKALCGEVMMPYEATAEMSCLEIMHIYGVSQGFARTRKKY